MSEIRSLNGLYFEVQSFKERNHFRNEELMIVMNSKYKPVGFEIDKPTLFGIDLLFSPYVEDVLLAKKFNEKFLGL